MKFGNNFMIHLKNRKLEVSGVFVEKPSAGSQVWSVQSWLWGSQGQGLTFLGLRDETVMMSVFGSKRLRSLPNVRWWDFSERPGLEELVSSAAVLQTSTQPCAVWPFGLRAGMREWTKRKEAPLSVNNFLRNLFFLEVRDCDGKAGEAVWSAATIEQRNKGTCFLWGRDWTGGAVELGLKWYDHLDWDNVHSGASTPLRMLAGVWFPHRGTVWSTALFVHSPCDHYEWIGNPISWPKGTMLSLTRRAGGLPLGQETWQVCRRLDPSWTGLVALPEMGLLEARASQGCGAATKRGSEV